jgi:8-oxo-dGTP pyrophosphatase MutT (NUDIX family)
MWWWIVLVCVLAAQTIRARASYAHQQEQNTLIVYIGRRYLRLFPVSRCFTPWICAFFTWRYAGLTFEVVHAIILDRHGKVMLGRRRIATTATHDLGVAGMVPHRMTPHEAMAKELREEVKVAGLPALVDTLFPCDGCSLVVHLFELITERPPTLPDTPDVFEEVCMVEYDRLLSQQQLGKNHFFIRGTMEIVNNGLVHAMVELARGSVVHITKTVV